VLVERAKQLVNIAQEIENAFLSTLEKRDPEYYQLLRALPTFLLAFIHLGKDCYFTLILTVLDLVGVPPASHTTGWGPPFI
jgi:hypothetical protein